jgi:hypothetical protein
LSARPGAIADIDAPTEAAASVEIVTRARHDARALVRGLPASHRRLPPITVGIRFVASTMASDTSMVPASTSPSNLDR